MQPTPNIRLDRRLQEKYTEISRAQIEKMISSGLVTVNGEAQTKAGFKVKPKDKVVLNLKDVEPARPLDIEIIYEDKDCLVINKPAGVLTHSKGAFNPESTVASWLSDKIKGLSGDRGGIVHRLDRATSGVMICAKTPEAQSWLQKQFSTRKTKKSYEAIVQGQLAQSDAIIDMPIERNPKKPQTFRAGPNGKAALTEYHLVKTANGLSLIKLMPVTGRTHQLRVHLAHLGHPILGDTLYGGHPADRLYLHAEFLELTLPNKTRQVFSVPTPPEFAKMLK